MNAGSHSGLLLQKLLKMMGGLLGMENETVFIRRSQRRTVGT